MPVMTLIEYAKGQTNDEFRAGIIEGVAGSSGVLENIPVINISGNAYHYNQRVTRPGIAFRGVNEEWVSSAGIINPMTETLTIMGGQMSVDVFIVETEGYERLGQEQASQIEARGLAWTRQFLHGDNSDPRAFPGLDLRLQNSQVISAGNTANGAALSIKILDEAIDNTRNPTHLIMSKGMRRLLTAAAKNTSVGGFITYDVSAFGKQVAVYNGLPIIELDLDNLDAPILGFNETPAGGGTNTSSSIYVVSFTNDGVVALQNGAMRARDLGLQGTKYVSYMEWYQSIAVLNGKAATRLKDIGNLAFVA